VPRLRRVQPCVVAGNGTAAGQRNRGTHATRNCKTLQGAVATCFTVLYTKGRYIA
jgi:hypothetical protein